MLLENRKLFSWRSLGLLLLGTIAAAASLPLGLIAADSYFGLGSIFVVPFVALGVVFTITACDRRRRAWWFAFALTAGLLLQVCPWTTNAVMEMANFLQRESQRGVISLSQRVIEPVSTLVIVFGPPLAVLLLGRVAGGWMLRRTRPADASESPAPRWRFSVRELAIGAAGAALILGLSANQMRSFGARENRSQQQFLARFESSFQGDKVKLLAPPRLAEVQRTLIPESGYRSFLPPGINEYRIVAPIEKEGRQCWALWAYTTNGEHNDMIYKFAYIEAADEDQLPPLPYPLMSYTSATWKMKDGMPE